MSPDELLTKQKLFDKYDRLRTLLALMDRKANPLQWRGPAKPQLRPEIFTNPYPELRREYEG